MREKAVCHGGCSVRDFEIILRINALRVISVDFVKAAAPALVAIELECLKEEQHSYRSGKLTTIFR